MAMANPRVRALSGITTSKAISPRRAPCFYRMLPLASYLSMGMDPSAFTQRLVAAQARPLSHREHHLPSRPRRVTAMFASLGRTFLIYHQDKCHVYKTFARGLRLDFRPTHTTAATTPHAYMLPPAAGVSASAVNAQVKELIGLVDKLLLIKGATVTHRGGLRSTGTMPPPSRDDVPVAIHLFADTNVATHLAADQPDLVSFDSICARAMALMAIPIVTDATCAQLCAKFAKECHSAHERAVFATYKVPDQVYQLRFRRQRAREPEVQVFTLIVITSISPSGLPQSYTTTLHPVEVSWADFKLALTNASVCWQTVHAGVEAGYTTEHGRWFWQAARQAQRLDKLKPMTSLADFERLRAELRVPDTWIIVWHVRTITPSHPIIISLTPHSRSASSTSPSASALKLRR